MEKNWLIRTKSNHILGPITKDKVIELLNNGSIKPDDEVCSGNGFWFFIREDDMVAKYLLGSEPQGFNPISEAKNVITSSPHEEVSHEEVKDDITLIGNIKLDNIAEPSPPSKANVSQVKSPLPVHGDAPKKKSNVDIIEPLPKEIRITTASKTRHVKSQEYLRILGALGFILLFALLYFRKTIIRTFIEEVSTTEISLINKVHAQENLPAKKKSSLIGKLV